MSATLTFPDAARVARLFDFTPAVEPLTFATAEAAWFWTMAQMEAVRDGAKRHPTADAVCKVIDRLYRQRRLEGAHVIHMREWGLRGCAPDADPALRLWLNAMVELGAALRDRGIVRRPA